MTKPTKRNDDEEKRKSSASLPPSDSSKPIEACITVQKPPDPPGRAQTTPLTRNAEMKNFHPTTALGVELLMSTAEHPQTDDQAEAAVKVFQKLPKPFVFQGQDWEELLPSLEFAYNDMTQSSTGQTPFYLNYGHHPTGATRHEPVDNPHAEDQVQYLLRLQEAARDAINDAQRVQRRNADKKRMAATLIKKGDWVLLRRKDSEKRKLAPIADGPFQVTKAGTNCVTLRFLPKSRAHPTVNISRVQLYFGPRPQLVTAPPEDEAMREYAVDRIIGYKKRNGKEYYYIHWKGYPAEEDTWEPKGNLNEAALKSWERQNQKSGENDVRQDIGNPRHRTAMDHAD